MKYFQLNKNTKQNAFLCICGNTFDIYIVDREMQVYGTEGTHF